MNSASTDTVSKNTSQVKQAGMTSFHVIAAPSIILIVAILFGNSLVIASYKINRRLKTRTNAFLVSLAVSDFLVGSISLPMCIYGITSEPWNVSIAFNAVFKSFDVFAALASIFHLTAISMERYIAVSRPFYYKRLPSLFQRVLITTAWSAACFLALLSNFTLLKNSWSSQCYSLVLFICGLVVPTTIIARMYIGVFSVARSLQQRNPSHTTTKQSDGSLKRYYQGEKKVAITVALITVLFIAAWLPFFAVSVTAAFCVHCLSSSPDSLYRIIVIVKSVHYMNSAVNPLVYARRDREMRQTFLRLLGLHSGTSRFSFEKSSPEALAMRTI